MGQARVPVRSGVGSRTSGVQDRGEPDARRLDREIRRVHCPTRFAGFRDRRAPAGPDHWMVMPQQLVAPVMPPP